MGAERARDLRSPGLGCRLSLSALQPAPCQVSSFHWSLVWLLCGCQDPGSQIAAWKDDPKDAEEGLEGYPTICTPTFLFTSPFWLGTQAGEPWLPKESSETTWHWALCLSGFFLAQAFCHVACGLPMDHLNGGVLVLWLHTRSFPNVHNKLVSTGGCYK